MPRHRDAMEGRCEIAAAWGWFCPPAFLAPLTSQGHQERREHRGADFRGGLLSISSCTKRHLAGSGADWS